MSSHDFQEKFAIESGSLHHSFPALSRYAFQEILPAAMNNFSRKSLRLQYYIYARNLASKLARFTPGPFQLSLTRDISGQTLKSILSKSDFIIYPEFKRMKEH
jgi:hypothetical protein